MDVISVFKQEKSILFQLNDDLDVIGLSSSLSRYPSLKSFMGCSIKKVLETLFDTSSFSNTPFVESLLPTLKASQKTKTVYSQYFIVTNSLDNSVFYEFTLNLDYILSETQVITLRFDDFNTITDRFQAYKAIYRTFDSIFSFLYNLVKTGHFIIDYTVSDSLLFADDVFANLLSLSPTPNSSYPFNLDNPSDIRKDPIFYKRFKLLVNGQIETFIDEWKIDNTWLRLEAKVIKKDKQGKCQIIGGILNDVTSIKLAENVSYIQSVYDLAIKSGGIGIFYYNLDKYTNDFFEANEIYADMLGIEPNDEGRYLLEDFMKVLLPLEENISSNEDVRKSLSKILKGDIQGTSDDIIKIKNLKTNEIKYLLSSSKVDSRYENGEPRLFGGIVIEITDRINKEKNHIAYAYRDELTLLANNRKLTKDMVERGDGIGLFFDLDNFKKVNDTYGHQMGDKILQIFGTSLKKVSNHKKNTYVYRLHGDEFFVFCEGYNESIAQIFNQELHEEIKKDNEIRKINIPVEASMGYALYKAKTDIDDFIKNADYAMYRTKIQKKTGH